MLPHPMMRPSGRTMPMQSPVPEKELAATYEYRPLYFEPFIAWRAWSVLALDGRLRLRSVTYQVFWPCRDDMRAECQAKGDHDAPLAGHGCGIYSLKDVADAIQWALHGTSAFRVIGEVKIYGRILQYEKGYISERAYPASILIPHDTSHWEGQRGELDAEPEEIALILEDAYGVPASVGWPE